MATHDFSSEIYINSATELDDFNNSLSNWTSKFPIPIQLDKDTQYALSVLSCSISNTFPQFHPTEQKFKLNAIELTVDTNVVHNNTTELCQYLTNLCTVGGVNMVFSFDSSTKRIRITNDEAIDVELDLSAEYLPFWKKIGFNYDAKRSLTGVTLTPSDDILLNYVCRLIPTQRVFVTCNQIVGNSYYPTTSNLPILCQVDFTGGYGSYSFNERPFPYEHDLVYRTTFSSLQFSLLDDQFRPLTDMKGGSVNLSLVVKKVNYND